MTRVVAVIVALAIVAVPAVVTQTMIVAAIALVEKTTATSGDNFGSELMGVIINFFF